MGRSKLRRGNWSVQELERLRLLLPNRGVEHTATLLRRSAESVQRKALELMRVPPRKGAWTDSDDWQLRQAWGAVEARVLGPLLGRPSGEVRLRAGQLRQRLRTDAWTSEDLRLLKRHYGTRRDEDLEVCLMRPRADIVVAAKKLCLAKDKKFQAAILALQRGEAGQRGANGHRVAAAESAAVDSRCAPSTPEHQRSPMPRWTTAEVERLRQLYPDQDNLKVARALGRSVTSVANKAYQLGIHKSPELLQTIGRSNIAHRYGSAMPNPLSEPPHEIHQADGASKAAGQAASDVQRGRSAEGSAADSAGCDGTAAT